MTEAYDIWTELLNWIKSDEIYQCRKEALPDYIEAKFRQLGGSGNMLFSNGTEVVVEGRSQAEAVMDALMMKFIDKLEMRNRIGNLWWIGTATDDVEDEFKFEYGKEWPIRI